MPTNMYGSDRPGAIKHRISSMSLLLSVHMPQHTINESDFLEHVYQAQMKKSDTLAMQKQLAHDRGRPLLRYMQWPSEEQNEADIWGIRRSRQSG